ncbi:hypothetical protein, partial [Flavonifractor sp. An306]|uniref:hypothetical protein n=1 Tax=Flavonifractor sp. An306 TaxID=1965629 RepID=UPI000B556937
MAKADMNTILKRRMAAAQQASELQASDEAYQQIFQRAPPSAPSEICDLPLDKLDNFFTADIGFKPYSPAKLEAFAQQLQEEGLLVRIMMTASTPALCLWITPACTPRPPAIPPEVIRCPRPRP